ASGTLLRPSPAPVPPPAASLRRPGRSGGELARLLQRRLPSEVGVQRRGHLDAAVLEVTDLQQGRDDAGEGEAGAIEGVQEADTAVLASIAEVGAAGLEVDEVGDAGDLQPLTRAGRPYLDVVGH